MFPLALIQEVGKPVHKVRHVKGDFCALNVPVMAVVCMDRQQITPREKERAAVHQIVHYSVCLPIATHTVE